MMDWQIVKIESYTKDNGRTCLEISTKSEALGLSHVFGSEIDDPKQTSEWSGSFDECVWAATEWYSRKENRAA